MTRILLIGYGLWCWLVFALVALTALLLGVPAPRLAWRRQIARRVARAYLSLTGARFVVRGLEHLPAGPCVVVANHASYIDGLVLVAALPARFAFVIKNEMVRVPLAGLRHRGAVDARRVVRTATSGQALAFFPEGTFTEQRGLGRFHPGAFVAATRAGVPLVPAAIRGAREVLPPDTLWPRPGRIEVDILAPLPAPSATGRAAANELRDATRAVLLARLGEP
ncbi:MAG: lysophospholipid acyltransferase family protein, partial [Proteobacteria bacterium]|nr:lysophospholipid acyltransferase family protein [Pseudomonadota bacterium]